MKNKVYDNDTLIESLKNGDEKAYAYLIDTYHHMLCVYANSLIKNIYNAEDIVQNAFLKLWEQRTSLKSDYTIKNFLYKLVYNEFIDVYRKNQSLFSLEKTYHDTLNVIVQQDNEESFENAINIVNKKIENLPPKCKEIFILSKKEGLTNVEISEHLDISIKTVEAQITKAFSILRTSLQEKIKNFLFLLFGNRKLYR
ncbi:RNA polymerase sigma-70 factor (ECF subfamily) [Flavobacterium sp. 90]|uniref:RNA polymerase sigma factor n=1 Tax=unclassified Flavobacterium TaxID=196869 RepID=UPI000EAD82B4|nr:MULTISPECIES: RNA polymerase sigma-70 factor [unclassified Flavobacterium]RKR08946.1 RNA polymerase sigma-70 factor (ECF subfamily) [Flavobacterium sp. 81]TCK52734.1 RNA polymerase sigma-70 factor (ECF subfamily) [Flavobacterium sp. 90]